MAAAANEPLPPLVVTALRADERKLLNAVLSATSHDDALVLARKLLVDAARDNADD